MMSPQQKAVQHWLKHVMPCLLAGALLCLPASAQELDTEDPALAKSPASGMKPISITVSKTLYLPAEMYGHWRLVLTLTDSNSGNFSPVGYETWMLERQGDEVVLSNPENGGQATVQVQEVQGNTATFQRTFMRDANTIQFELTRITVAGDRLNGFILNKYQHLKNGKIKRSYFTKYALDARRVGKAPEAFIQDNDSESDQEVEEVRFSDDS